MRLFRRSNVLLALLVASSSSGCAKSVFVLDALGTDAGLGVADGGSVDGAMTNDGGKLDDAGVIADAGAKSDAGTVDDASVDAGTVDDASVDAGTVDDASFDAGTIADASFDAGTIVDASFDAGTIGDASFDAGTIGDASFDAGTVDAGLPDSGMIVDAGAFDAGAPDAAVDSGLMCDATGPTPGSVDTSVLGTDGYGTRALSAAGRAIAAQMVGSWIGTRTQSWEPTRHLGITFFPNGAYSAFCFDCCAPFAFGEVAPDMRPSWRIDIADEVQADGELILYYDGTSGSTLESLHHIHFDGTHLTFDLWHLGYFGPVHFDLTRPAP